MNRKFLFPVILFAGLILVNFSVHQVYGQTPKNEPVKQQTAMYTCSMHPEVVKDQPGNCPKCGMELVKKKDMPKEDMHQAHDSTCMKHEHTKMMPDSACMKHEHTKMMPDSACMKHEHTKMMSDSACMKHEQMKMMPDSAILRKNSMLQDTTGKKPEHMEMTTSH
jgi:hypothetical protein